MLMDEVSNKYTDFGVRFDIAHPVMDGWFRENRDNKKCWIKVMEHWLKNAKPSHEYPATWEGLLRLLRDVGCTNEANKLETLQESIL
jgi:hypothetical protein